MTFYYLQLSATASTGVDSIEPKNTDDSPFIFSQVLINISWSCLVAYLPTYAYTYYKSKQDGNPLKWLQRSAFWSIIREYFQACIELKQPLDHSKQYIFSNFPHGAWTG